MAAGVGIHVGDTVAFVDTVKDQDGNVIDISLATTKSFRFQRPDGSSYDRDATFETDGQDGKLRYAAPEGELDRPGYWERQVHVVLPATDAHGSVARFRVYPNVGSA